MLIAIPKEILPEEKRVVATPETVRKYIALGFTIAVETGAGEGVLISDDAYRAAGATIATDVVPPARPLPRMLKKCWPKRMRCSRSSSRSTTSKRTNTRPTCFVMAAC